MDGIFGVGLPEMLIIALALFIVGGPRNTAKWARELGVWARKARQAWTKVVSEMEEELGPEGKEVMDAARELGKGVNEMRGMNPTRRAMNETLRMVGDMTNAKDERPQLPAPVSKTASEGSAPLSSESDESQTTLTGSPAPASVTADTSQTKYTAWIPKDTSR